MGTATLNPAANAEWKPSAEDKPDVQGIVVSAYPNLGSAALLMVKFSGTGPNPRAWFRDIVLRITNSTGDASPSMNLAISAAGLKNIGAEDTLKTFSRPFQEGMTFGNRPRFLGDVEGQAPATWEWSDCESSPNCVHAQLMLYAKNQIVLADLLKAEKAKLDQFGLGIVTEILLQVNSDADGKGHEHFGFVDGISQPRLVDGKVPVAKRALHEIAAGEVVFGQDNTYGVPAPGPIVAPSTAAKRHLKPAQLKGFFDLGRNGSYIVIRQLKQDVSAFWNNMRAAATGLVDAAGKPASDEWLAAKAIGRTLSGDLLLPKGVTADNSAAFFDPDRMGLGCPATSHVRRANPRDGAAPEKGDIADIIQATNRHRILRRGRIYGDPVKDRYANNDENRGLVFICLNSEIERQFEFVQHTWLLNPMFGGKFQESDPLVGPKCPFSIPSHPVRQQPTLETFITARGGGYFFLPSLSAIRYLGDL
jgi:Dyp-type peroxidase family